MLNAIIFGLTSKKVLEVTRTRGRFIMEIVEIFFHWLLRGQKIQTMLPFSSELQPNTASKLAFAVEVTVSNAKESRYFHKKILVWFIRHAQPKMCLKSFKHLKLSRHTPKSNTNTWKWSQSQADNMLFVERKELVCSELFPGHLIYWLHFGHTPEKMHFQVFFLVSKNFRKILCTSIWGR